MTNEEFQKAILAKLEKLEINQTEMQKTQTEMLKTQVEMQKTQTEMQRKLDVVYAEVAGLLEFRSEIIENITSINEMLGDDELSIKTLKKKQFKLAIFASFLLFNKFFNHPIGKGRQ